MLHRIRPETKPLLLLSDIHGRIDALEAVLDQTRGFDIGTILVAGDLLLSTLPTPHENYDPIATWRRLKAIGARCVSGLSDRALVKVDPGLIEVQDEVEAARLAAFAEVQRSLGDLVLHELKQLPLLLHIPLVDGAEICVTHGSPLDPLQELDFTMTDEALLEAIDDDVAEYIVCGMTHVPFQRRVDEYTVLNVGSVGEAPGEPESAHFSVITPKAAGAEIAQFIARL